ncbi:hypothetical protein O7599_08775 [Streptomyces sp. WMMC500]|uniref:hypothetical protein n=1 Tax=Streptomyces sp. WMMC500 TaxID=3015154 RepID=UPI00248D2FDE|nr:hypothetical protein [Streptomyces sp. WMMC500]WBB62607.1 hypothetical protein O7599_08775 [Streptomyces sp. WMMC500]
MRSTTGATAHDEGEERRRGRIELSGAQVAGGASATMVAAFLASSMGVYGTIVGAGVVSVGATAGGALFQHVFRRTGQQLKDAAVAAPKALHKQTTPLPAPVRNRADDETHLLRTVASPADDATRLLPVARPEPGDPATGPAAPLPAGGFGAPRTHGTRARGWRRVAPVAAGTFLAVMAVVFGIEKLTGGPLSNAWGDDRTGTSFSPGEQKSDSPPAPDDGDHTTDGTLEPGSEETEGTGGTGETGGTPGTGSGEPRDGGTGSPDDGTGGDPEPGGTSTPQPGGGDRPAPGAGGGGGTTPAPTPTTTPPGTGEDGQEPPGTGETPAPPQPDGATAPGATR